jgi:7-cyano-7-deazaguanine synthase
MPKAIVLLSGGLDSSTVAAKAVAENYEVIALSLNYGQKNLRELQSAQKVAKKLGIKEHFVIKVSLAEWGGSLLTTQDETSQKDESQSREVLGNYVPGRNTVFIAIAFSLAEAKRAELIYLGFSAADKYYPDTQQLYLEAFEKLTSLSTKAGIAGSAPRLVAPLIKDDKVSIALQAIQLEVPIAETWSCYLGKEDPCGLCSACHIRDRAFIQAGRVDLATSKGQELYNEEAQHITRLFWRFMLRR